MKYSCKECGKKYISQDYLDTHIKDKHKSYGELRAKGWATPYGFMDFSHPVTRKEAFEMAKKFKQNLWDKKNG